MNESCEKTAGGCCGPAAASRRPELPLARCSRTFKTRDARTCSQNVQNSPVSPPPVFLATQVVRRRDVCGKAAAPAACWVPGLVEV